MSSQPTEPSARDHLRPLFRRWWLVLIIVVPTCVATYAYYERQPKVFEASTKILLAASGNPLDQLNELTDRTIQDQAGLLTSRDVATRVARRLKRPGDTDELVDSVSTVVTPGSSFVVIYASRPNADEAARLANAFARAFVELRTETVRQRADRAIAAAQKQLETIPRLASTTTERQTLSDAIRQLRLARSVSGGTASQVDPARSPGSPISPRPVRSTMLALAVSLIGAVGLAFALESFDRRPRRLDELAGLYGMPILAAMPRVGRSAYSDGGRAAVNPQFKEPLRQLRTNIQLATLSQPFRTILVTSAVAGEGKSTIVRNLALVLREGGLRVAVIDGDLRRPTLAKLFKQQSAPGLTDVLTGSVSLANAVVEVPVQVHGLDTLARMGEGSGAGGTLTGTNEGAVSLLPAGPQPADPQAVLSADRMRVLIEHMAGQYDIVLIDSPPLLHVTDAVVMAAWVDAVILVARLGLVTRDNARRVPDVLGKAAGARAIGIVVNDATSADGSSYGYGYGY